MLQRRACGVAHPLDEICFILGTVNTTKLDLTPWRFIFFFFGFSIKIYFQIANSVIGTIINFCLSLDRKYFCFNEKKNLSIFTWRINHIKLFSWEQNFKDMQQRNYLRWPRPKRISTHPPTQPNTHLNLNRPRLIKSNTSMIQSDGCPRIVFVSFIYRRWSLPIKPKQTRFPSDV